MERTRTRKTCRIHSVYLLPRRPPSMTPGVSWSWTVSWIIDSVVVAGLLLLAVFVVFVFVADSFVAAFDSAAAAAAAVVAAVVAVVAVLAFADVALLFAS